MSATAVPARPTHRLTAAAARATGWANRIRTALPGPLRWLTARPQRLVTLAWLMGLILVGHVHAAAADTFITGPDLANGGPRTLFETFDFTTYDFLVKPDDNASGFLDLGSTFYGVVGVLNDLLLWISLGLLYGTLVLLEWFLQLTLYRNSASQIDAATQLVADHVFWPLIACTTAIGAFLAYARWRGEGRGFASDLGWVIASTVLAIGFAAGPSTIMLNVDSLRTDMATGIVAGTTDYVHNDAIGNPTGFPEPALSGGTQASATRELVDSIWNLYGAYFWCHGEFGPGADGITICQQAGYHALANDSTWQGWMRQLDAQETPPVFGAEGYWIRGQDLRRLGIVLVLAVITIPTALLFLRLVFAGLKAVVGLLLMLILGLLFLTFWPIPGWFRTTGTRYWVYVIGMEGQALFITFVVSGQMVVVAIIGTQTAQYGYFVVGVLVAMSAAGAARAQAWLEGLTTGGGGRAMGLGTVMAVRYLAGAVAGMVSGGTGMVAAGARALIPAGRGGGSSWAAARQWAGLRGPQFWVDRRRRRNMTYPGPNWRSSGPAALPPGAGPRPSLGTSVRGGPALTGPPRRALMSGEANRAAAEQRHVEAAQQRNATQTARATAQRECDQERFYGQVSGASRRALYERHDRVRTGQTAWDGSRYRQATPKPTPVNSQRTIIGTYSRHWIAASNGGVWGIAHKPGVTALFRGRLPRPYRSTQDGGESDGQ